MSIENLEDIIEPQVDDFTLADIVEDEEINPLFDEGYGIPKYGEPTLVSYETKIKDGEIEHNINIDYGAVDQDDTELIFSNDSSTADLYIGKFELFYKGGLILYGHASNGGLDYPTSNIAVGVPVLSNDGSNHPVVMFKINKSPLYSIDNVDITYAGESATGVTLVTSPDDSIVEIQHTLSAVDIPVGGMLEQYKLDIEYSFDSKDLTKEEIGKMFVEYKEIVDLTPATLVFGTVTKTDGAGESDISIPFTLTDTANNLVNVFFEAKDQYGNVSHMEVVPKEHIATVNPFTLALNMRGKYRLYAHLNMGRGIPSKTSVSAEFEGTYKDNIKYDYNMFYAKGVLKFILYTDNRKAGESVTASVTFTDNKTNTPVTKSVVIPANVSHKDTLEFDVAHRKDRYDLTFNIDYTVPSNKETDEYTHLIFTRTGLLSHEFYRKGNVILTPMELLVPKFKANGYDLTISNIGKNDPDDVEHALNVFKLEILDNTNAVIFTQDVHLSHNTVTHKLPAKGDYIIRITGGGKTLDTPYTLNVTPVTLAKPTYRQVGERLIVEDISRIDPSDIATGTYVVDIVDENKATLTPALLNTVALNATRTEFDVSALDKSKKYYIRLSLSGALNDVFVELLLKVSGAVFEKPLLTSTGTGLHASNLVVDDPDSQYADDSYILTLYKVGTSGNTKVSSVTIKKATTTHNFAVTDAGEYFVEIAPQHSTVVAAVNSLHVTKTASVVSLSKPTLTVAGKVLTIGTMTLTDTASQFSGDLTVKLLDDSDKEITVTPAVTITVKADGTTDPTTITSPVPGTLHVEIDAGKLAHITSSEVVVVPTTPTIAVPTHSIAGKVITINEVTINDPDDQVTGDLTATLLDSTGKTVTGVTAVKSTITNHKAPKFTITALTPGTYQVKLEAGKATRTITGLVIAAVNPTASGFKISVKDQVITVPAITITDTDKVIGTGDVTLELLDDAGASLSPAVTTTVKVATSGKTATATFTAVPAGKYKVKATFGTVNLKTSTNTVTVVAP